jgi:hypothetical protein
MRDPARLKDYNRSVRAELLMLMPRANFIAEAGAILGREGDWPNTLIHNDGTKPPVPIAAQLAAALLEEAQMFSQDMKETTGIYEAELGMRPTRPLELRSSAASNRAMSPRSSTTTTPIPRCRKRARS